MIEKILIAVLLTTTILFGGLYFSSNNLGVTSGTDHYNAEVFHNTLTAGCTKIYQTGATTNASTTYYLMASTSLGAAASGGYFPIFATSSKPTNCP